MGLSCLAAPPCTLVLPTGCRRRSLPLLPPPLRSRSLLLPRGSTPSGSVAPSSLPSPPSSRCGSRSRSTTSAAPPLSTGSAFKHLCSSHSRNALHVSFIQYILFQYNACNDFVSDAVVTSDILYFRIYGPNIEPAIF